MELLEPGYRRPLPPIAATFAGEYREPVEPGQWGVIIAVGGLCWLIVTLTALLWMAPTSGSTMDGMYVVTNRARTVQHLLVFVVAACAYRVAIALGWPASLLGRVRAALANSLLAITVVFFSPLALALVAGYVDGRPLEMR